MKVVRYWLGILSPGDCALVPQSAYRSRFSNKRGDGFNHRPVFLAIPETSNLKNNR